MTTAILSALPEEQSSLLQHLAQPQRVVHAGRAFWRGDWQGRSVVLALSGIGKVAAATTATALAERFGVARIVFTGVAGGVGDGVQVGDVVVAQDYVQHDMDASPIFPRWELPGYARTRLGCDAALTHSLRTALRNADHDVLAVEMEGAAVAQVCHDYGLPFAAVRTISDRADDTAHVDFPAFVNTVATRYAEHIMQERQA
eukprot:gene20420-20333_t